MIEERIKGALEDALLALGLSPKEIELEHPVELLHGDFASNIAFSLSKDAGKSPKELAEDIVSFISSRGDIEIEKVEVAGPGFINFFLSKKFLEASVKEVLDNEDEWGKNNLLSGKKIMVEYTQPNPFKPFHIGHLMSNTIGESISRLVEFSGAEVKRANYQGDIGLHVAKALWAIGREGFDARDIDQIGKAYTYGHEHYETDEVAKEQIVELNKRITEKDSDLMEIYEVGLHTSLNHFEDIYKMLGTTFDYYFFESQSLPEGLKQIDRGLKEGIFEESEGAVVFRGEKYGLHTRVFRTRYGTSTYETRDLGLPIIKYKEFPFSTGVTVTAVEQSSYFDVVFKAFSLLNPDFKGDLKHISHGMMQLQEGKMSSRKGNVITGEALLHDVRNKALLRMKDSGRTASEEIADAVAVSAIKYSVLQQGTGKNITFNPEQALSFEGDSGPYLQYTNARILSVLLKAKEEHVETKVGESGGTSVEKLLYRFPEVVRRATKYYEPHYVTTYLIELAGAFNSWYGQEKILDGTPNASHKLAIAQAVSITLQNGLWLLGIRAPEQM